MFNMLHCGSVLCSYIVLLFSSCLSADTIVSKATTGRRAVLHSLQHRCNTIEHSLIDPFVHSNLIKAIVRDAIGSIPQSREGA